jgi:predicted nucleic acid-binding protein
MTVLVDTPIWSLALRRRSPDRASHQEHRLVAEWEALVREDRGAILGIVRQEVLSGIAHEAEYQRLRRVLQAFADIRIRRSDHEQAAACFNRCRGHGIRGSPVDFLICAVAMRLEIPIFTTGDDFEHYPRHLPIALHTARVA